MSQSLHCVKHTNGIFFCLRTPLKFDETSKYIFNSGGLACFVDFHKTIVTISLFCPSAVPQEEASFWTQQDPRVGPVRHGAHCCWWDGDWVCGSKHQTGNATSNYANYLCVPLFCYWCLTIQRTVNMTVNEMFWLVQFWFQWANCLCVFRWWLTIERSGTHSRASGAAICSEWTTTQL